MMSKVVLTKWSPGLDKVQLTKLIRTAAGIPLDEAHDAVNRLLTGQSVEIAIPSETGAAQFVQQANALGATAQLASDKVTVK